MAAVTVALPSTGSAFIPGSFQSWIRDWNWPNDKGNVPVPRAFQWQNKNLNQAHHVSSPSTKHMKQQAWLKCKNAHSHLMPKCLWLLSFTTALWGRSPAVPILEGRETDNTSEADNVSSHHESLALHNSWQKWSSKPSLKQIKICISSPLLCFPSQQSRAVDLGCSHFTNAKGRLILCVCVGGVVYKRKPAKPFPLLR